jgi:IS30 family transposase
MPVKLLTLKERVVIEDMLKKGASYPQIGAAISRSKNTIRNEVRKFGKKERYSAKQAQRLCDTAPERRRKPLLKWVAANKRPITASTIKKRQKRISERLSLVEQKVETLISLTKERDNAINKRP